MRGTHGVRHWIATLLRAVCVMLTLWAWPAVAVAQQAAPPPGPQASPEEMRPQDRAIERLANQGQIAAAEALSRDVLRDDVAQLGENDPVTLDSVARLVTILAKMKRGQEAIPLAAHALRGMRAQLGDTHPKTLSVVVELGDLLFAAGQRDTAIAVLSKAVDGYRETGLSGEEQSMRAKNNLAHFLFLEGQKEEGWRLQAEAVRDGLSALGPADQLVVSMLSGFADMVRAGPGVAEMPEPWLVQAELMLESFGPEHPDTLRAMSALADGYFEAGQFGAAIPWLQRVVTISETLKGPDGTDTLDALQKLADSYREQGAGSQQLAVQTELLGRIQRKYGPDADVTLIAMQKYALALQAVGRPAEARSVLQRSLAGFEAMGAGAGMLAKLRHDIGMTYAETGETEQAIAEIEQALAGYFDAGGEDSHFVDEAFSNLATLLFEAGQEDRAIALMRVVAERVPDPVLQLRSMMNFASMLLYDGQNDAAVRLLQLLRPEAERRFGPASSHAIDILDKLVTAHLLEAPDQALAYAREARRRQAEAGPVVGLIAEAERRRLLHQSMQVAWSQMEAAWHLDQVAPDPALREEAFEAAQVLGLGPSSVAFAQASGRLGAARAGLAPLVEEYEELRRALDRLDRQVAGGLSGDTAGSQALLARKSELELRRRAVLNDLRVSFPEYFDLINPGPVPAGQLQGRGGGAPMLAPEEALVLITPGYTDPGVNQPMDFVGFVFVVTREGMSWSRLQVTDRVLSEAVRDFRTSVLGSDGGVLRAPVSAPQEAGGGARPFDGELSHDIFKALFPTAEIQSALLGKERLLISPQGALLSLPFGALVTAPAPAAVSRPDDLRALSWLGLDKAIAIVPAVSMLSDRGGARDTAGGTYIGFGDPDFQSAPERSSLRLLPQLPGTGREVRDVAVSLGAGPGSVFLGAGASESQLIALDRSGQLAGARILHLATHGLTGGQLPGLEEAAIALAAGPGGPDPSRDGFLTATEAAALSLGAELVILSACNTAAGRGIGGQGLTGLARGFLYAGARGLLVTHWEIRDDVSARLVADMVSPQSTNGPVSEALRRSLQKVVADTSADGGAVSFAHPSVWAAFQVVGPDG
ncbi:CHAT domain-containing protein [Pseudooceanicola sp. C21-150M6]|uniref:CHAT domain-containing tetratricopeptide repeat protein n=1 Tax=Pseudooceanicola sp. C21-150M6 TaxID=3434355 RepID=UPI003D7FA340